MDYLDHCVDDINAYNDKTKKTKKKLKKKEANRKRVG